MDIEYKHSLPAKILGGSIGIVSGALVGSAVSILLGAYKTSGLYSIIGGTVLGAVIDASRGNELYNDIINHINNPCVESTDNDTDHQKEYKHSLSAKILGGSVGIVSGGIIGKLGSMFIKQDVMALVLPLSGALLGTVIGTYCGNELYNDAIDHINLTGNNYLNDTYSI